MTTRFIRLSLGAFVLLASLAEGARKPQQTAWGYAASGTVEAYDRLSIHPNLIRTLGRGALVAVYGEKEKGGKRWSEIITTKPSTPEPVRGWADSGQMKYFPPDRFPADSALLDRAGTPFNDDMVAASTLIDRFLLQRPSGELVLVCLIESPAVANVRMQFFVTTPQGYTPGPYLELPNADIHSPLSELEARDAVGDGNECLISHESFSLGAENQGTRIVVRRLEGGAIKTLWTAPIEYTNLSSFDPRPLKLTPPERNVGAPGTVSKATVEFRLNGGQAEIFWKAAIEFHIPGREKPVDTLSVEKHCHWNGNRFDPIL